MPRSPVLHRLRTGAVAGPALAVAVVVAVVWASSPGGDAYRSLWGRQVGGHSLASWVADGPMTLFFLVIGMEVKAELVTGRLASARAAVVPVAAALGGMVVPALVYLAVTRGGPGAAGWAVPMATDVAMATGVLALAGARVPSGVGVLLLALAVVDDIGAIIVIAVAYADAPSFAWLAVAAGGLAVVAALLRRLPSRTGDDLARPDAWGRPQFAEGGAVALAVVLGVGVWAATYRSGVHATIAGVALGLVAPVGTAPRLTARLRPWTDLLVVPLFALSHAGVDLTSPALGRSAGSPVAWGAGLGLAVGKPVGVVAGTLAVVALGRGRLPDGLTARHVVGLGALAGVGFTVSLFVAELAFDRAALVDQATVGVLAGSLVAGAAGVALLRRPRGEPSAYRARRHRPTELP